jgi:hypothetical protein
VQINGVSCSPSSDSCVAVDRNGNVIFGRIAAASADRGRRRQRQA